MATAAAECLVPLAASHACCTTVSKISHGLFALSPHLSINMHHIGIVLMSSVKLQVNIPMRESVQHVQRESVSQVSMSQLSKDTSLSQMRGGMRCTLGEGP